MTTTASVAATAIVLLAALWYRPLLISPRGLMGPRRRQPAGRRSTPPPTADEWATLLDAIAADIRSGASLTAACERATIRADLTGAVIRPGCSPPFDVSGSPAAAATSARRPARRTHTTATADEAVVLQSLAAAHSLGGPMAATLHAGAALLRERAAIRAEALTHSAQARLSARVLTAVPVLFAAWSLLSSDSFRAAALSTLGLASATLGGLCNLAGWYWMRRIVGRVAA